MTPAALRALVDGDMSNFIAASTPGGIERQEKQGQIDQSFRETLPIDGTLKDRPVWEALGFVFGENADDLFVNVKFPEGWKKVTTDHSMWTNLVDGKGRKRAGIFYKAAFYDRSSHIRLERRFSYDPYRRSEDKPGLWECWVIDCGKPSKLIGECAERNYQECDSLRGKALEWLKANYPEYENVAAYWD